MILSEQTFENEANINWQKICKNATIMRTYKHKKGKSNSRSKEQLFTISKEQLFNEYKICLSTIALFSTIVFSGCK